MTSLSRVASLLFVGSVVSFNSLQTYAIDLELPSDINDDAFVSHADYSLLADSFGSIYFLEDFDGYRDNYGTSSGGGPSPLFANLSLSITPVATSDSNIEWTIAFLNVSGGLAGHLSIDLEGGDILSVEPGSAFQDNQDSVIGVPGDLVDTAAELGAGSPPFGVHFNKDKAYAALGTTLTESVDNASLTYLTVVTEGLQATTLTVLGGQNDSGSGHSAYGYLGWDFFFAADISTTFSVTPGDLNGDGFVGGADYTVLRDFSGESLAADYQTFFANFSPPPNTNTQAGFVRVVPEPSALVLCSAACLGLLSMVPGRAPRRHGRYG